MNRRPFPHTSQLAPTLARRVFEMREFRNLTKLDLARRSRFTVQRIDDIESGLETWFSAPDRQILAKALGMEPALLLEVETRAVITNTSESHMLDAKVAANLSAAILEGEENLPCPDCRSTLKCTVQDGLDIDGRPIFIARADCPKCPFVLRNNAR